MRSPAASPDVAGYDPAANPRAKSRDRSAEGDGIDKKARDIIHAEGVRFAVPSSAPEARKVLSLWEDIRGADANEQPRECWARPVRM